MTESVAEEAKAIIGEILAAGLSPEQQADLDVVFAVLRQKVEDALRKRDERIAVLEEVRRCAHHLYDDSAGLTTSVRILGVALDLAANGKPKC